jgi:DnaA-homolog protein
MANRPPPEMPVDDNLGPQLPLALRAPPDQQLERYLRAPAGLLGQLQALASGDTVDAVYLQGAASTGKTHLVVGCCSLATKLGRQASYLALANVRGHLREAGEGLDADLVAFDDVDAIAGNREDEVALFDLHNRLRDAGRSVLYAASAAPDALPLVLPDLRSRMAQCTRWTLPVLDDDARAELLRQRAATRGLDFDEAALDWMLRRCSRDLGSLTALFDRLDRASLVAQRRLTVPFLRQVLGAD